MKCDRLVSMKLSDVIVLWVQYYTLNASVLCASVRQKCSQDRAKQRRNLQWENRASAIMAFLLWFLKKYIRHKKKIGENSMKLLRYTHTLRLVTLLTCSLILVVVFAACGGSSSSTTSTPTPTVKPSPTPSPTPAVSFTTYTGNSYTIGYPQGWKVTSSNNGEQITFTDSATMYFVGIIVAPNPNGITSANTFLNAEVDAVQKNVKNSQVVNVPPTTTIGGDTWVQKSLAGTINSNGQTGDFQIVFACDNHPANTPSTKSFTILYGATKSSFASANSTYFQSMLQSFKFTS